MASQDSYPIPQPPSSLFLGNVSDIDPSNVPASFQRLAEIYGDIYYLDLPGRQGRTIVVSSYETINDCCDASRFEKPIDGTLKQVRALTGDGLFTAYPGEKNWGVAHRLLMPVFGPIGIRKMLPAMTDIASQMLLKWDRLGPENEIICSEDFTRLAFDVIGLCAFGYRFNNFYSEHTHPFVEQMSDVLLESGRRANRLEIENKLRVFAAAKLGDDIKKMHDLCDKIIEDRVKHPQPDALDLLNPMLEGVDKETGEKMTKECVKFNMVTFLVAGHETTSGTLSFLFYHLLKNPETYLRAQQEVDDVLGDRPVEAKDLSRLVYIKFAIYEALRFMGPIGVNLKHALAPTKIAGKYEVQPNDGITLNLYGLHHDPAVWGNDANIYRPERFLNGGWENLPPNAWKPFGDGMRACIGRTFAEQEMILVVALILQNFQVELADPAYNLRVKVTLTQKPDQLAMKVRRRPGRTLASLGGAGSTVQTRPEKPAAEKMTPANLKPITVLYGSNAGTCKSFAEDMQTNAPRYGFKAVVGTLDAATENVPMNQPVIIIEPSYEGKPADNANKFTSWLEQNNDTHLFDGLKYAVFGVGNSDWTNTFHRIPKLTDQLLEKLGGERCAPFGSVDVKEDIMGPWEDWQEKTWSTLREAYGQTSDVATNQLIAEVSPPKFATLLGSTEIDYGVVKANKELSTRDVGSMKKHMEIELPIGTSYRAGDYMVVLPMNNMEATKRVLKRFSLSPDDNVTISGTNKAFLSNTSAISVFDLLTTRVELGTPASQKQIKTLASSLAEENTKLANLADDEVYAREVLSKRMSVLDLLEDYLECQISFAEYLDMLKPLTPRQYSISSSPLANVEFVTTPSGSGQRLFATLTYDVHEGPAWSGAKGLFRGVASTYLAHREEGDRIRCFTRATKIKFHLPLDPMVPIIMVCAGTGIAPMRAFIQERATIKKARNAALGPAILYFGCRNYENDYIYSDELRQWESEGVVSVRACFSKVAPSGEATQYVPDRMWHDREELARLFKDEQGKIFVCGSASKLAKSTAEVCMKIWLEKNKGSGQEDAEAWLEKVKEDRYVTDVFH